MATSESVPMAYQIKYGKGWHAKLQEAKARFMDFVTYKPDCTGRMATVDQVDTIDLVQKTSRHENTPMVDPTVGGRIIFPKTYHRKVGWDEDDNWKLGQQNVPIHETAAELWKGGQRVMTDVIFAGINGDNTVRNGEEEATTTESFDTTNYQIGVQIGDADGANNTNTDMNPTKVRNALQILMESEAFDGDDADEQPVLALSARNINSLWEHTKVTSSDFVNDKTLDTGKLQNWLGVRFVRSQRVPTSGNNRQALMWVKSCVVFGVFDNWNSHMWIDDDTGGIRYRVKVSLGSCRKQQEGVVRILCDETAAFGA